MHGSTELYDDCGDLVPLAHLARLKDTDDSQTRTTLLLDQNADGL